jgi:hypothetical protein
MKVFEWHQRFKNGCEMLKDDPREIGIQNYGMRM